MSEIKSYIVAVSKEKDLVNGLTAMKDIIYYKQKLQLYNEYKKLSDLKMKIFGIKTDCIFYEGSDKSIQSNFNLKKSLIVLIKYTFDDGKYDLISVSHCCNNLTGTIKKLQFVFNLNIFS